MASSPIIISFKPPHLLNNPILIVLSGVLHWEPQKDRASEGSTALKKPRAERNTDMRLVSY